MIDGWPEDSSPFHRGEQALHAKLGIQERQEAMGRRMMRRFMPDQHRDFFANLPFVIMGSVDPSGAPWASIVAGQPGFVRTPTNQSIRIDAPPLEDDPLLQGLTPDAPVSLLGIEPETRRRNRANLRVTSNDASGFDLRLTMSFGNCPQYIQARQSDWSGQRAAPAKDVIDHLTPDAVSMITNADTFFVASNNDQDDPDDVGGVDVNHRGGKPGFIKIDGNTLTIPDFKGNNAFNTLGNFMVNPKGGLLFVDFESGDVLQMTGRVEILHDANEAETGLVGALRAWRFTFANGHFLRGAVPANWTIVDYARQLEKTGQW